MRGPREMNFGRLNRKRMGNLSQANVSWSFLIGPDS